MENIPKNKKGFTLIELLIVIATIGILAGVTLVSTSSGSSKAKDNSALASMRGVAMAALECMLDESYGIRRRLSYPNSAGASICCKGLLITDNIASCSDSSTLWPDISRTGWGTISGSDVSYDHFSYCFVNYSQSTHPTSVNGGLSTFDWGYSQGESPGNLGGYRGGGQFCFGIANGDWDNCAANSHCTGTTATKWIWCTQAGCKKEGF